MGDPELGPGFANFEEALDSFFKGVVQPYLQGIFGRAMAKEVEKAPQETIIGSILLLIVNNAPLNTVVDPEYMEAIRAEVSEILMDSWDEAQRVRARIQEKQEAADEIIRILEDKERKTQEIQKLQ
jgi:hypothetical protein